MAVKLAIIIDNIANGAGTERAVSNLCNGLLKYYSDSYCITIISLFSQQGQLSFFDLDPNIQILHLEKENNFKLWNKFFWYRHLVRQVRRVNQENSFDVLMGTTYVHNLLLPLLVRKTATKTIGCEHVIYEYPPKIFQRVRKMIYPKLNRVIVLNQAEQQKFYFLSNTSVVPNSLPFESSHRASLNHKSIISVGRITHEKGMDLLIEVYEKIQQQASDWTMNIYGDGEDLSTLKARVAHKGLEKNIFLHGSEKNISEKYLQNSIFVLGSRSESFGIVVIEAMNHGLPVVSFDTDGPRNSIVEGENGFLVPCFNLDRFSEKLLWLIDNQEKRKQMGAHAFASSEKYKEDKIIPIWNKQLQQIFKGHP